MDTFGSVTEPTTEQGGWAGWWFLSRLLPDAPIGWTYRRYRLTGPLDVAALAAAWRGLLRREPALRRAVLEHDGRPSVVVRPPGSVADPNVTDLRGTSPAVAEAQLAAGIARELAEVTDLSRGEPARLRVFRCPGSRTEILLGLHAVAADGLAVDRLAAQLFHAYRAGPQAGADRLAISRPQAVADRLEVTSQGQAPGRADPSVGASADPSVGASAAGVPVLSLPTDRPRPAAPTWQAATVRFDWGTATSAALRSGCRATQADPATVLAAGYLTLLARHVGADRVGLTAATGPGAGVGTRHTGFVTVVADVHDAPTFRTLVDRVRTGFARAVADPRPAHQLVRASQVDRDPRRVPLCDAVLVVRDGTAPARMPGVTVREVPVEPSVTLADLTLTVDGTGPALTGQLTYRSELFAPATADGLLGQLRTLLLAGLSAPDTPVALLPLDDPADVPPPDVAVDGPRPAAPTHECIRRRTARDGARTAVAGPTATLTYQQLDRAATDVARLLPDVAGAAVAIRLSPGPQQIAATLGAWHAGASISWFSVDQAEERSRQMLATLRPAALLVDAAGDDELARWYRDVLGGRLLVVGDPADGPASAGPVRQSPVDGPAERAADDSVLRRPAYTAFTSGSTGRPKGVVQSHEALAQFVTWFADAFGLGPGSRVAQWVTPDHDPSLCEVFATLVAGAAVHTVPARIRVHPEKLVDWLVAERISFLQTVPSFARELLGAVRARTGRAGLPHLRWLVLMGERVPGGLVDALANALPDTALANVYGPTETIAATWHVLTPPVAGAVPIGRPIPGRTMLVVDEHDRVCPTGVVGQLVVRSRYVTPGYLGLADRSAFRPVVPSDPPGADAGAGAGAGAGGWYRTGDLGRRRFDGPLEFHGRQDLQIKLYGNRLELTEIEAALTELPTVTECAVVPVTDLDGLVTQVVALVVPRTAGATPGPWRAHLRRRFGAALARVSLVVHPGRLPRNAAGKLDRRRLRLPQQVLTDPPRAPRGEVEQALADIWTRLLGAPPRTDRDTFFARGGHSLLVPALAQLVRHRFDIDVSVADLYANPSLAGMSGLVTAARRPATSGAGPTVPAPTATRS
ncbi:AMP-binding protein [Solwaraspora sp. WMMA2056]|uniref:AMP-binding protein n=1 Tax=Solwaraspora sp. WMMA2056 TaxID=3015161 RepID=UPI00259BCFA4|nr:AMP-binding protein [Solwaraspora sp. WMMA2056]WJK42579.1 AMP-binding protein [Solwaraspora sp. WMMA2056]